LSEGRVWAGCYSKDLLLTPHGIGAPALATLVGLAGAAVGLWLTDAHRRSRVLVPFSAGVLLGVAAFGLIPELVHEIGWGPALTLALAGYGLLLSINRWVYPVCPTCSHDHDHNSCSTELHGFAAPLIGAAALHSFLDGWSVATVQLAAPLGLRVAVPIAVALHKAPEGIAIGAILRVSVKSRAAALAWSAVAEGTTLLGGVAGLRLGPQAGSAWITYPLGIAAGWICYLGYHAVHEEARRRGLRPALLSALCGVAAAALVQRGAEALLR
jgi:zinc transporter ZupT